MNTYWSESDAEISEHFKDYTKHLHHFFNALISRKIFQSPGPYEFSELGIDVDGFLVHPGTIYHVRNIALANERINMKSKTFLDNTINPLIQILQNELTKK